MREALRVAIVMGGGVSCGWFGGGARSGALAELHRHARAGPTGWRSTCPRGPAPARSTTSPTSLVHAARRPGGSQTPLFRVEADPHGKDGEGPPGVRWELIPNAG